MRKSVLITDLDNTLFDWVDLWYHCFSSMLDQVVAISGLDKELLKAEIRAVHRKHGTSEYSLLIEEIPSIQKKFSGQDIMKIFAPAVEAFRKQRREHLRLYPTVAETLLLIKGRGTKIIAYTESMGFYSNYRIRRLGLDGVIDVIFSPRDHDLPAGMSSDQIRKYPAAHYDLKYTLHEHTPAGSTKPDAAVLESIIVDLHLSKADCIYVGDSPYKDVPMAQDVGVDDILAEYGKAQDRPEYQLLREVTHWSNDDVEREKRIQARDVRASYRLTKSFSELLDLFEFRDSNVG
jgi:FMN phosphatase YigB (HAD superfamily)